MTFGILKLIALVMPLRVTNREEGVGMDVAQHGEEAYARGEGAVLVPPEALAPRMERAPAGVTFLAAEGA
jgi:Amt family ammonium transporter